MSVPPVLPVVPHVEITAENSCNCFCFRIRKWGSRNATPTASSTTQHPEITVQHLALSVLKSSG